MSRSNGKSSSLLKQLSKLFGLSALAGVLALALLAPTTIIGGFAASAGISVFDALPDYIKPVNASDASTIYGLKKGAPVKIASFYEENRISVPFSEMSPNIVNAVVSTEDPRFYQHNGVDWISLLRATLTNVATVGNGPGGSTITMQYVKNAQVQAAAIAGNQEAVAAATAGGVSGLGRKVQQIRMALALEKTTPKKDILAGYLNLSFFGNQIYGVEAASEFYFEIGRAHV